MGEKAGVMKHHLSERASCKDIAVKIIWPRTMTVTRDGQGKERKVAWHDEEGERHATATGKAVEKVVEDSMRKWLAKVSPEPATESEESE